MARNYYLGFNIANIYFCGEKKKIQYDAILSKMVGLAINLI